MRITQGKFKRSYLYDVRLGRRAVQAVYAGRKKVWPTLSDLVQQVSLAALEGVEDAYWHHTLGVLRGEYELCSDASGTGARAIVTVGGKSFCLLCARADYPAFPVVGYGSGVLFFGDNGAPVTDVAVGDEVPVWVHIPEHMTGSFASRVEDVGFTQRWYTRWVPGTRFQYDHYKGRKKVCPWANGSVAGEKSGKTYFIAPWHNHAGHRRGDSTGAHWQNPEPGLVPDYDDDVFRVTMDVGGASGIRYCRMVFPAFTRTFRFKITDIVRHG